MSKKPMTKADFRDAFGTFNPVGHVVIAFDDDDTAGQAAQALREGGFGDADLLAYNSAELKPQLQEMVQHSSDARGFGYEITLMRRYLEYAEDGVGWLIAHVSDDAKARRVAEVAKQFEARSAVRYHRLASEDLL